MKVLLRNVRLAFPHLWEPRKFSEDSKPRYESTLCFAEDHPAFKDVTDAIEAVIKEAWPTKAAEYGRTMKANHKLCLQNGNMKTGKQFEDLWLLSANTYQPPKVIDTDRSELRPNSTRIYPGCYVNASVDIWAQDNNFGKRVNAQLLGIQFWEDGDRWGGGSAYDPNDFPEGEKRADAANDDDLDPFAGE